MEREIIQSMVASIPESLASDEIEKSMMWEETDGGASFSVVRHLLPTSVDKDLEVIAMSVSGRSSERKRIIDEFTEALGAPIVFDYDSEMMDKVDVLMWQINADEVLESL